jgi:hypothetical protein
MYGIFGEDRSDFETLKEIVWKLKADKSLKIKGMGFGGCGNLIKACWKPLKLLHSQGFQRFIVCHDADDRNPDEVRRLIDERVIKPAGLGPDSDHIIAVPVRAIEAWILADVEAVSQLFKSWTPKEVSNPESLAHPKEKLITMSREGKSNARYKHRVDNPRIIEHLNLDRVAQKCPSFRLLRQFVLKN